jgi:O-antigen/teichoic acid export membrane protein
MSTEQADEFDEIRGALGSIGLSAVIVLSGSILSQVMGFGTRIVMTRYLPVDGYGDIVLGITVLNILGIVSIIGLGAALIRYLPRAESDEEHTRIAATVYQIGIGLALFWAVVSFLAADIIAGVIFESPAMADVIRVFAIGLPFYVLMRLSLKGIQGHKATTPNIITKQVVRPVGQLVAVGAVSLAGFRTIGLAVGYNVGFALAGLVGFAFFLRAGGHQIRGLLRPSGTSRYREILGFSAPLAVSSSFGLVTQNSDRFLLGVFKAGDVVGIYDVAFLASQFILFFGPVLNYLFQPIISELDADDDIHRMDKLYKIVTRWLVILTFPIFVLLFLFPEMVLGTLFGTEYRAGAGPLALLTVGYFAARFVGLSGSFLTATGDTKVLMYVSGTTAALNLVLNVALIPVLGAFGAATATVLAIVLNNGLQAGYVYKSTGIHPFSKELLLPVSLATAVVAGAKWIISGSGQSFTEGFAISAGVASTLILLILLTRSVYVVELKLVDSLSQKVGLQLELEDRLRVFSKQKVHSGDDER